MATVLSACVRNAGRSQIAAAFFNQMANSARAQALSAGTQPATAVHPEVVSVMREIGIEVSQARSQLLGGTAKCQGQQHPLRTDQLLFGDGGSGNL